MILKSRRLSLLIFLVVLYHVASISTVKMQPVDSLPDDETFIYGGLAWSPDGQMLAVGTNKGVWLHRTTDLKPIDHFMEHSMITSMAWSPTNNELVISSKDGIHRVLTVWQIEMDQRRLDLVGHTFVILSVAWSPDGLLIASNSFDNTIRVWDADTGQIQHILQPPESHQILYPLTWSPDSTKIVSSVIGGSETGIVGWDIESGEISFHWPHFIETYTVEWSPDGKFIAAGGLNDVITIWDAFTGTHLYDLGESSISTIRTLAWDAVSTRLAASIELSDSVYEVQIWDTNTVKLIITLPNVIMTGDGFYTNAMAWSPDDSELASISDDGKVYIWNAENYELVAVFEEYKSIVLSNDISGS